MYTITITETNEAGASLGQVTTIVVDTSGEPRVEDFRLSGTIHEIPQIDLPGLIKALNVSAALIPVVATPVTRTKVNPASVGLAETKKTPPAKPAKKAAPPVKPAKKAAPATRQQRRTMPDDIGEVIKQSGENATAIADAYKVGYQTAYSWLKTWRKIEKVTAQTEATSSTEN